MTTKVFRWTLACTIGLPFLALLAVAGMLEFISSKVLAPPSNWWIRRLNRMTDWYANRERHGGTHDASI